MSGHFKELAIPTSSGLMFGKSNATVKCGFGLELGKGEVYPEINFTLPSMILDESTWKTVVEHYEEI